MQSQTLGDKIFNILNIILMILLCITMIYPLLFVFGRSFMGEVEQAVRPFAFIPNDWNFDGYMFIFAKGSYIPNAFLVTITRTLLGTFLNLLFTALMAYVLSKKRYPFRVPVTFFVVFTMWFGGGLVPSYMLNVQLGLLNNFWVYIIPGLISAWNMTLMRNFFMAVPEEIEESAKIDGASELVLLFQIYLPLSTASLATLALFYAVGHWNAWFDAVMYINDRGLWTIQMVLKEIIGSANTTSLLDAMAVQEVDPPAEQVKYATILVTTVPILCVYPFLQKYFVKGVMVGSLKG